MRYCGIVQWREALLAIAFGLGWADSLSADVLTPVDEAEVRVLAFGNPTEEQLARAMVSLADEELRPVIIKALKDREKFPREQLVGLLVHPKLAVRLGALEVLEDAAGTDFDFKPWAAPEHSSVSDSLEQWQSWALGEEEIQSGDITLTKEQAETLIRDILSDKASRADRAHRLLSGYGLSAAAALQEYIEENPTLPAGQRAKLKAAQYRVVLKAPLGQWAADVSRNLASGSRDQVLDALTTLKAKGGIQALPVVRDFLGSDEPIVRETAIDALFEIGGSRVLRLALEVLEEEEDPNVLLAAVRQIGDQEARGGIDFLAGLFDHEEEDLAVASLHAFAEIDSALAAPSKRVVAVLEDPRWRVRTAALECLAELDYANASDEIISLLDDEDSFVRFSAVNAISEIGIRKAKPTLEKLFFEDPEMLGPVVEALCKMNGGISDKMLDHLMKSQGDEALTAVRPLTDDDADDLKALRRLAGHQNLDVAFAATGALASEGLENSDTIKFLTKAILDQDTARRDAAIRGLKVPSNVRNNVGGYLKPTGKIEKTKTALDPLYDAFLAPLVAAQAEETEIVVNEEIPSKLGDLAPLASELLRLLPEIEDEEIQVAGALALAQMGVAGGYEFLNTNLAGYDAARRTMIADRVYRARSDAVRPLLSSLVQDPLEGVRDEAAYSALYDEESSGLFELLLNELEVPGGRLKPHSVYSYSFLDGARERGTLDVVRTWAYKVLGDDSVAPSLRVLAMTGLEMSWREEDEAVVVPMTTSSNQWLRRQAWWVLGKGRSDFFSENLSTITGDPSAAVRVVVPLVFGESGSPKAWAVHFDDLHSKYDSKPSSSSSRFRRSTADSDAVNEALRDLQSDEAERVRFEAAFALLSRGEEIELSEFITLAKTQEPGVNVGERLAEYLADNHRSLGGGFFPLLSVADLTEVKSSERDAVLSHFGVGGSSAITSFEGLATKESSDTSVVEVEEDNETWSDLENPTPNAFEVVMFYLPGCKECARAEAMIERFQSDYPEMTVDLQNIREEEGSRLNIALAHRVGAPPRDQGVTPSIFTQAGYLTKTDIDLQSVDELLNESAHMPPDPNWRVFGSEELAEAGDALEDNFRRLGPIPVFLAGLLDGVNPCAFATIIFFLSYLQIAKRTPREILMVGMAFISAVFITYFAIGLGLSELLGGLERFAGARTILNLVFALFALFVAVMSWRDARIAQRGQLKDMALQLPGFLKDRIKTQIRKGAKSTRFVVAAFVSGIVISLLELACTGQVYAPIIYAIKQGYASAFGLLLLYNVAFILPLLAVFLLAYRGMRSDALIRFQDKHTAKVKYGTAVLFFILFAVLIRTL